MMSSMSGTADMGNAPDIVFRPAGELPPGLELSADGTLRGTPTAAGEYVFTVSATDSKGVVASRNFMLTVSASEKTATTPVAVPWFWLEREAAAILAAKGGDYEAAAKAKAANGRTVWECYVAGVGTTNAAAEFRVKSISISDGQVTVEWDPDLNLNGTATNRAYVVQGKRTMDGKWDETDEDSRFFRVLVRMPE